jgi:hypothetical protein
MSPQIVNSVKVNETVGGVMKRALTMAILVTMVTVSQANAGGDWRGHIDWAIGNTDAGGSVDCPWLYIPNNLGHCIIAGGRACVSQQAIYVAKSGYNDPYAWYLMQITQCHNPDAMEEIIKAGPRNVADYLRTK